MHLTIRELIDYTGEERATWRGWFAGHGDGPLKIALAGADHPSVGALIVHFFWTELFYARWLSGEVISKDSVVVHEHKDVRADETASLFHFGEFTRRELRGFTDAASPNDWERTYEVTSSGFHLKGPARKLVAHLLVHEIRHWAQVAIVVRQSGLVPPGDHDLLFSKSFGPLVRRTAKGPLE